MENLETVPSLLPSPEETARLRDKGIDIDLAVDSFPYFTEKIFSHSTEIFKNDTFTGGEFPMMICQWMQDNKNTLRVSAKDHFKSLSFYAHIMWKLYRLYFLEQSREIQYFSYNSTMAEYHLAKIKKAIKCNPYFAEIQDLKPRAESVLAYTWDGYKTITVDPWGLMEFNRGIHCDDVYVDDPLQDPENQMILTKITKINQLMKLKILDMPQQELHVAGTSQTPVDFFFDPKFTRRFAVKKLPAIINMETHQTLWPEWMGWDELMEKKAERGEKVFNQEYLVSPVYSENAFLKRERVMTVIKEGNRNYTPAEWAEFNAKRAEKKEKTDYDRVAGWDLGKKSHPAHFTIFEIRNKVAVQVHEKWFDNIDYEDQLAHIDNCIDVFGVYVVYYDSTRGELEIKQESGDLRPEYEAVVFTHKFKVASSTEFDKAITNKTVELLYAERSINQLCLVTNDLQAPATPEGHADNFWSICLTFTRLIGTVDIHLL